jgi:hypothetical protein
MERKYIAIITGPKEYLPGGFKREEFVITQEDIDEYLDGDDSETEEDAIVYYKEEYKAAWAQGWCNVQLLTEDEIAKIESKSMSAAENLFDDDDGEEEEEEEDELDDWE